MAKGPVNLGGVLSCRTVGVQSTPGVRGGASPAYSEVPKSQELGQLGACRAEGPVNLGGVLSCITEGVRSTPAYSAVPKSRE